MPSAGSFEIVQVDPVGSLPWENPLSVGSPRIETIEELAINEAVTHHVGTGHTYAWEPDSGIDTVVSEHFTPCMAIVVSNRDNSGYMFVHARPLDEEAFYEMQASEHPPAEALFVLGTLSRYQPHFGQLLASRGAKLMAAQVETGRTSFSIAFNPLSGLVSVVRKAPDRSIIQYQPFQTASS